MIECGSCSVGLCNQYVRIDWYGSEAADLVDFVCCDLQINSCASPRATYRLTVAGDDTLFSLNRGKKQIYRGDCRYDLAYILINEIIYQCIVENDAGFAIHAASVGSESRGVLFPGTSGAGKSTLVTWLVSHGCNYLTDELVVLAGDDHRIYPLTRPISIKTGSLSAVSSFWDYHRRGVVAGEDGVMVPHRLVNSFYSAVEPPLSLIIFPKYRAGAAASLVELSGAVGCAGLIGCYVNARNIRDHGIGSLAELVRTTPVYQLTYGSFDGLYDLLGGAFPVFFKKGN